MQRAAGRCCFIVACCLAAPPTNTVFCRFSDECGTRCLTAVDSLLWLGCRVVDNKQFCSFESGDDALVKSFRPVGCLRRRRNATPHTRKCTSFSMCECSQCHRIGWRCIAVPFAVPHARFHCCLTRRCRKFFSLALFGRHARVQPIHQPLEKWCRCHVSSTAVLWQ